MSLKNDHLAHHGVEGQKWGHRHGPPYPLDDNPRTQAVKKKKKLPKTALGLWLKNNSLTEEEYAQAVRKINRDRAVRDGVIHDAYQLEKAANYPNVWLNDIVKAWKNVDWIRAKINGKIITMPAIIENNEVRPLSLNSGKAVANLPYRSSASKSNIYTDNPVFDPDTAPTKYVSKTSGKTYFDASKGPTTTELDMAAEEFNAALQAGKMKKFKHSDFNLPSLAHDDMNDINNYLCHYGVLGMKWGVRRGLRAGILAGGISGIGAHKQAKRIRRGARLTRRAGTAVGIGSAIGAHKYVKNMRKRAKRTGTVVGLASMPIARRLAKDTAKNVAVSAMTGGLVNNYATKKRLKKHVRRAAVGAFVASRIKKARNKKKMKHSDFNLPSLVHNDMNEINNYLCHYGVLGMKWGVHRARQHEKNLMTYNIYKKRMNKKAAKELYKKRMSDIKGKAKAGLYSDKTVKSIYNSSHREAKSKINDYDEKRRRQIAGNAAVGVSSAAAAAALGSAAYNHFNARARGSREIANGKAQVLGGATGHRLATEMNNKETAERIKLGAFYGGVAGGAALANKYRNKKEFGKNAGSRVNQPSWNRWDYYMTKSNKKKNSKSKKKFKTQSSIIGDIGKAVGKQTRKTNSVLKKAFIK